MKEWAISFWNEHGSRLIFMAIVMLIGWLFFQFAWEEEAKVLWVAVGTLALNKARSPKSEAPEATNQEPDNVTS
jgi:hypothetical protein